MGLIIFESFNNINKKIEYFIYDVNNVDNEDRCSEPAGRDMPEEISCLVSITRISFSLKTNLY